MFRQLTRVVNRISPIIQKGDEVIIDMPLSNADADMVFGKGGYRVVNVPSEKGQNLQKNYMRFTRDPSASILTRLKRKIPGLRSVSAGSLVSFVCLIGAIALFPEFTKGLGKRVKF